MAYLGLEDYSLRTTVQHLNNEILAEAILGTSLSTTQVRNNAENWAIALIRSYLKAQYNIDSEFAKNAPDASRNPVIVQLAIDLALCTLHKTINPRNIPEHIAIGCDDAAKTLAAIRDKLILLDLPPLTSSSTDTVFPDTFLGSQEKFISKPFSDAKLFDPES